MTTVNMTIIKEILENKGYSVFFGPPEKAAENQVSMEVVDMALEIEGTVLYHFHTELSLGISTSAPETLSTKIIKLIKDVEEQLYADSILNRGAFKFTTINFSKPGELYVVSVRCNFFESIMISI